MTSVTTAKAMLLPTIRNYKDIKKQCTFGREALLSKIPNSSSYGIN